MSSQSQGSSSRSFDELLRKDDDERQPTPKENHRDAELHGLALPRPSWRYPVHAAGPYSARTIASHLTSRVMDHVSGCDGSRGSSNVEQENEQEWREEGGETATIPAGVVRHGRILSCG